MMLEKRILLIKFSKGKFLDNIIILTFLSFVPLKTLLDAVEKIILLNIYYY